MTKSASPPNVAPETWRSLLAAASEFAALKPWEFAFDSDVVGLVDPATGETRVGHVLGNAGEVFAAVFYRRAGLRWILAVLGEAPDPEDLNNVDGMDCLKVEFVPRRELRKEDLAVLNAAAFKPGGRGSVWPQFRSSAPGWHPWHIDQTEADQLLTDLPRLTAFCRLFEQHPGLLDNHPLAEIPFLPVTLPDRPLAPEDLDWRPLVPPPAAGLEPFQASDKELETLGSFKSAPGLECEFDCTVMPGGSFYENGRPCFGRISLLVEKQHGTVVGMDVQSGALAPGEAAGRSLVKALLMAGTLPKNIVVGGARLQPVLQPLCDKLKIGLSPVSSLPLFDEAIEALSHQMLMTAGAPGL